MSSGEPNVQRGGGGRGQGGGRGGGRAGGRAGGRGGGAGGQRIPDLLIPSILVTIFCCQIGGIIAIIYAAGANSSKARGDFRRATEQAKTAKTWIFVSVGVGLVFILGYIAIMVFAGVSGGM